MTILHTELTGGTQLARGTQEFHLAKPAGFEFSPGQSIDLSLTGTPDGAPLQDVMHTFSLVSAPHEGQLTVATRMRDSAFKNALADLPVGATLQFEGPFGTALVPDDSARPLVLIAGGIGITPFMSILRDAAYRQLQRPLRLLYSNRRPEDTAFLAELQQLQQQYPPFSLVATMTNMDDSALSWDGPTGYFDAAGIRQHCQDLEQPLFYLSGPPAMVEAMYDILEDAGVDEDDIHSESFTGY